MTLNDVVSYIDRIDDKRQVEFYWHIPGTTGNYWHAIDLSNPDLVVYVSIKLQRVIGNAYMDTMKYTASCQVSRCNSLIEFINFACAGLGITLV